jgi:winged helix DNA-binding protein
MILAMSDIARQRLRRQHLTGPALADAPAVVRTLGAVQAQDYAGAKWAVAQRMQGLGTDSAIEAAFASGAILRTHVLRPTWHFVLPEDIRWMLELTAPRIKSAMAYYDRQLGLDAKAFRTSNTVFERVLQGGQQLTRAELTAALRRAGVKVSTGQRVGHMLLRAELDRVIISGARRGKQFTYALFDERVPAAARRDRDDALRDLTRRYFATRGPATPQDFAWWSGLTVADAKRGMEAAGAPVAGAARPAPRIAHLLPNYDEYFIGFKDRSAFGERLRRARADHHVEALMGHIVFIDGQIVGGWRRTLGKHVDVELRLLVAVTAPERTLLRRAAQRFGKFLGLPVHVILTP